MSRPNWRKGKTAEQKPESQPEDVVSYVPPPPHSDTGIDINPKTTTCMMVYETCKEFCAYASPLWGEVVEKYSEVLESKNTYDERLDLGNEICVKFYSAFGKEFSKIVAKDDDFFALKISYLHDVNARELYTRASSSQKEKIWEFLKTVSQYSGMVDMYNKCPESMLRTLSGVAGGIIGKLQAGEMDISTLNPLALGQMMMKDMKSSDLESFGQAVLSGGNMENMMGLMMGSLENLPGGAPDISMLSSLMK
jgi:hypothetical protein